MNEKRSFVMYTDFKKYKDALGTTGKAELFDAILDYENDRTVQPEFTDRAAEAFFLVYKNQSDRNGEKWQETKRKRTEAARRRYARIAKSAGESERTAETPQAEAAARNGRTDEPKEHGRKDAERFEKPTVEEVAEYCEERKNGLDARTFFDFYESKGWKVGAARMKDWRACVRTWERRKKTESTGGRTGAIWGSENEVSQDIVDMI